MKKMILTAILILVAGPTFAQTTAKESLARLKTNYENSKANLADYQKNLKIVEGNLSEIAKAKVQLESQEKGVSESVDDSKKNLQATEAREAQINQLIQDEQKANQADEQKIQELEELVKDLRESQKKRQANVQNYQEQLKSASTEKKEWKGRTDQVSQTHNQLKSKLSALTAQETEWKNKKLGYEGEVSRWQKEVEREKKLVESNESLANVKD